MNNWGRLRVALATLSCLCVHASCNDPDGGAVELSWLLRPSNGDENACTEQSCCQTSQVQQIELTWNVGGVEGFDAWPCEDNRAVTKFEVPPGLATLSVVPVCAGGPAATNAYEAPAPVVRTLVAGEVVSLNAVVVQVAITQCGPPPMLQPCICQ